MISDPRYDPDAQRRELRAEIVNISQQILVTKPRQYWLAMFRKARIPSGAISGHRTSRVSMNMGSI